MTTNSELMAKIAALKAARGAKPLAPVEVSLPTELPPELPKAEEKKEEKKEEEKPKALGNLQAFLAARKATSSATSSPSSSSAPIVAVSLNAKTGEVTVAETGNKDKSEVSFDDLNDSQQLAVKLALSGKSFVLIGSAGSGKTTTQRIILQELLRMNKLPKLPKTVGSKYLSEGMPAALVTAFTKVATRNIREAAPLEFKRSCVNIHKAIEFAPTKVEIESLNDDGELSVKESMRFTPNKNRFDILDGIKLCIVEEAGSLDVELFMALADALPKTTAYIFLGDLNQLPPVYGAAILGFAINKLPVVELTHVYRQNAGAIKDLATAILKGKKIPAEDIEKLAATSREGATLEVNWFTSRKKVKLEEGTRLNKGLGDYLRKEVMAGNFVEGKTVVLTPIRKDTQEFLTMFQMNKHIAQALGEKRQAEVYEIRSRSIGGTNHYYACGDLVFFEKEYFRIVEINANRSYLSTFGMDYKMPSTSLNRWGVMATGNKLYAQETSDIDELLKDDLDDLLTSVDDTKESKNLISHTITLEQYDVEHDELPRRVTIDTSGDIAALQLGYAQTVHSSQGSEWETVYLLAPDNVSFMFNREMLYTAVTRARSKLTIWAENGKLPYNVGKGTFDAGIRKQAIEGDNLRAKRSYFRKLGESKTAYKHVPHMLERLNREGILNTENYYRINNNNQLELI